MVNKSVYLAGPISGLSYKDCTNWRVFAKDFFSKYRISAISPMRYKEYLSKETSIDDEYDSQITSTSRGIMARDYFDCTNAGVVLVNFIGAKHISIGSAMECAWAYSNKTPLIACIEKEKNIHDHAMIREAIDYRTDSLKEGLNIAVGILNDYP